MIELPVHQPKYSPVRTLMLYLTEDCNLRCTYCFVKKTPRAMSIDTARSTVDYILHRNISGNLRSLFINFFGGEPFMAMDVMEEIISYSKTAGHKARKQIRFGATTNATIATPRVEAIVRSTGMNLLVSMDGGEESMMSRPFVGGGSPFKAVSRNLKRLVKWSPSLTVRMTYHPGALELCDNVRRVLEMGAPSISLCPVPESDWRGSEDKLEQEYQKLADWFIAQALKDDFLPLEMTWQQLRLVHNHFQGGERPSRPCPVGTTLIAVDPDGQVMPCHRFLYRSKDWFGTVDNPSFPPEREKYVRLSSRDLLGCDTCLAEPLCGGGCRVVATADRYDLQTGVHPGHCLNARAHARAAFRIYETLMKQAPESFSCALRHYRPLTNAYGELAS